MTLIITAAAAEAAARPAAPSVSLPNPAGALFAAAGLLLPRLERGASLNAKTLRAVMETATRGSDAQGSWTWKDAYEACETAQALFLRKFGKAMGARAATPAAQLAMVAKIAALMPSQTKRSEQQTRLQQFSTPISLGFAASVAAAMTADDLVLEPSAGTGLLAIFAELASTRLVLNELAETRANLLAQLFPTTPLTRHDAAHIHDHLDASVRPTVVLMNPPFSAAAKVKGAIRGEDLKHVASALARLENGGRLVALTGANTSPDNAACREAFAHLQERATVVFTAAIDGRAYARHGTTAETRLTVIDRVPAEDPTKIMPSHGQAPDAATLLDWVVRFVPPRPKLKAAPIAPKPAPVIPQGRKAPRTGRLPHAPAPTLFSHAEPAALELAYEPRAERPDEASRITDALYESHTLQSIHIPSSQPHPTKLVQSAAMASVTPPKPAYRPHLPPAVVVGGLLSDAQLESVIFAGEAHAAHLAGLWLVDETGDAIAAAPDGEKNAIRFRKGWFLGDGTGAGKGRQVAGVILDNWLKGRRKALWISKSDALIEDARRDWSALGQEPLLVAPLSRFKHGAPIPLAEGILFTTYATLRSAERGGKASRVQQIIDWLGRDFDGAMVFDEAHALANAAGGKGERGDKKPSLQGRAGLRLQHQLADARVLYVSATGATTVQNLAYAQRLGLWGSTDFPFATRGEFVQAMEAGGVAATEVLARDLKALGLYAARSLSYEGVEVEILEHPLTLEQTRIYDAYAGAFKIIHHNLTAALAATNITNSGGGGVLDRQAKAAARSAFESAKQRFFNHLIVAMKTPTLIRAIEQDLAQGHACVAQIVSTGEAVMERRLAEIPAGEWNDLSIDVTPREAVCEYLAHSFPTGLQEVYSDEEGNLHSRLVLDENGQPVQSREAIELRDQAIEHIAALPPVQGALDQIVQRFGADQVAEVTGRSRRIVRKTGANGYERLAVETRAPSANIAETQAFMDDEKRILIFSDAGGTGRSYHADRSTKNQRKRIHYLLEPGWRADSAIQGLGRTNRANQAQPPLFRPVTTDVRGEKRFISTIARRLDSLGAITKGQRQTGGQGLFRPEDNLESIYAKAALRQFYQLIWRGKIAGCSLTEFENATGLELCIGGAALREDLPPITTFLNRMLALPIALQNLLFEAFEGLLEARIEQAIAAGDYEKGVETLTAHSLRTGARRPLFTHPATGAETTLLEMIRLDRNRPLSLAGALAMRDGGQPARLLVNERSGRAAIQLPAPSLMLDDGEVERRVRLVHPIKRQSLSVRELEASHWTETTPKAFAAAWEAEVDQVPEFSQSTFHVVTGLLLPIWDRLPRDTLRVYRMTTDDGERIIGRLLSPPLLDAVLLAFSLASTATDDGATPTLTPEDAWRAVLDDGATLALAGDFVVRRATVMSAARVERAGFTECAVSRLKAMGLVSEIISWKLRLFIPTDTRGPAILAALLSHRPLLRVWTRAQAA